MTVPYNYLSPTKSTPYLNDGFCFFPTRYLNAIFCFFFWLDLTYIKLSFLCISASLLLSTLRMPIRICILYIVVNQKEMPQCR